MTRNQDAASPPAVQALIAPKRSVGESRITHHASRLTFPALSLLLTLGLATAFAATPYQPIVERNVFGLKPPPPPPDPEAQKPPPSKITLTGIMTIFGKKQALMKTPPTPAGPAKPGQPPEPPKEHSYMLAEGQAEDGITVLQIDTEAKTVKVDNAGHIETIMFSTNAPTASTGVPTPTGMGGGVPQPGAFPRTIPRPLRIPTAGGGSAAVPGDGSAANPGWAAGAQPAVGGYGYGGVAGQTSVGQQQPSVGPQRSVEENVALAEINATKNEQLRAAGARIPPIPHHPLAAGLYGDQPQDQAPVQAPVQQMPFRPGMPQQLPQ